MKKLGAAILIYFGLAIAALAQVVSWPPPAGTIAFLCVYNTSPPAFTNGQVGFVQCDNSGNIITSVTSLSAGVANLSAALSGMNVNNAATSLALVGTNSAAALLSGTWVGTVTPYVSADGGTTYVAAQFFNPTTQAFSASATANGTYSIVGTGGMTHVKLVLSPYTSGTVTGNLSATSQAPSDASALYGLAFQLGTSGAPSSDVITSQGAPNMTPMRVFPVGTALAEGGITPVVGGSAISSLVLKASAGNLYSVYAECSAACWLMVFNAVAAPSNGATTAGVASGNMTECIPIAAGGVGGVNYAPGPAAIYSVGMTATISSTTCATLTLATTGFIHGMVQ